MNEDFTLNIVTLGKTGVGKSSLLNYLFGTNFETGVGKPVTGVDLIEKDADINGHKVRVYDSWGIEADKVNEWRALLKNKAQEHGAEKNPEDWFHSVVYCISAGGARVENIDAQIISDFLNQGYKVVVALTKADQGNEEDEDKLKKSILEAVVEKVDEKLVDFRIIPVCSCEKKTRSGESKPFGRDALIDAVLSSWVETVKNRISIAIVARLCNHLVQFKDNELEKLIREWDISGRREGNDELAKELESRIQKKLEYLTSVKLKEEADDLLKKCYNIGYDLQCSFGNETLSKIHSPFKKFDDENNKNIGWWYTGYVATIGIMPLINSFAPSFVQAQRDRLIAVMTDGIEECEKALETELLPQLQAQVKQILEVKKN